MTCRDLENTEWQTGRQADSQTGSHYIVTTPSLVIPSLLEKVDAGAQTPTSLESTWRVSASARCPQRGGGGGGEDVTRSKGNSGLGRREDDRVNDAIASVIKSVLAQTKLLEPESDCRGYVACRPFENVLRCWLAIRSHTQRDAGARGKNECMSE